MTFLADQDVYASTVEFLRALGHDVLTAEECGLSAAADIDLLARANLEMRIFVTRDRDYGHIVFTQTYGSGVIYLRIRVNTLLAVHAELARVLAKYTQQELLTRFVVIEPGQHRVRHPIDKP